MGRESRPQPLSPSSLDIQSIPEAYSRWSTTSRSVLTVSHDAFLHFTERVASIVHTKKFEYFTLLVIILNSIFLALDGVKNLAGILKYSEVIFLAYFTLEAALKLVAYKKKYFTKAWNIVDFVVVVTGYVSLFTTSANVSGLRVFRVLRPLKTVNRIAGMRILIEAGTSAIPMMTNVLLITMFLLFLFAVLGVQLWAGVFDRRCYVPNGPNILELSTIDTRRCSRRSFGHLCSDGECYEPATFPPGVDVRIPESEYLYGFNNLGSAFLVVFQVIVTDDWPDYVQGISDAYSSFGVIYFVACVILGNFISMNLVLAVLTWSFSNAATQRPVAVVSTSPTLTRAARIVTKSVRKLKALLQENQNTKQHYIRRSIRRLIIHRYFTNFLMFATAFNFIAMTVDHYEAPAALRRFSDWLSLICSVLFAAEALFKLTALGIWKYLSDKLNLLDFLLVIVSIIEIANAGTSAFTAFRALRLFRVMKVIQRWHTLRRLLVTIMTSLGSAGYLCLLVLLFIFIFTILGYQLFAGTLVESYSHRLTFNTVGDSALSVFVIFTGEAWNKFLQAEANAVHSGWVCIYFLSVFILGNVILSNLFVAILIENFARSKQEFERKSLANVQKSVDHWRKLMKRKVAPKPSDVIEDEFDTGPTKSPAASAPAASKTAPAIPSSKPHSVSVSLSFQDHFHQRTRHSSIPGEDSSPANRYVLHANPSANRRFSSHDIETNSVLLESEDEHLVREIEHDPIETSATKEVVLAVAGRIHDNFVNVERRLEYATTPAGRAPKAQRAFRTKSRWILAVVRWKYLEDCVSLLIVYNTMILSLDTPGGSDNCIQSKCTTTEWVSWSSDLVLSFLFVSEMLLFIFALGPRDYFREGWNVVDFTATLASVTTWGFPKLRFLRSIRIIRLVGRFEGPRTVITTLAKSIPEIANVIVLILLMWIVFAVLGVQLFAGIYHYCQDSDEQTDFDSFMTARYSYDQTECLRRGLVWNKRQYGFDNVALAMLSLFIVAVNEAWPSVMWDAVDGTEPHSHPNFMNNKAITVYFVTFSIIGTYISLNLFTSVLIDSFSSLSNNRGGLSEQQYDWIRTAQIVSKLKLPKMDPLPKGVWKRKVLKLLNHTLFNFFISGCIIVSALVMAITHYGMDEKLSFALRIVGIIFVAIFFIEMVLKMFTFGIKGYFRSNWNRFDFLIVLASIVGLGFDGPGASWLRLIRLGRLVQLVKKARGLSLVLTCLLTSIPEIANISLLLFITYYVYAVAGVQLCGQVNVDANPFLTPRLCFSNLLVGLLTLFQISTTESWYDLLRGLSHNADGCETRQDCGVHPGLALAFTISFLMICTYVMLNLFIAVVLQNYDNANFATKNIPFIEEFRARWSVFDRNRRLELSCGHFVLFMRLMPEIDGLKTRSAVDLLRTFSELQIPITEKRTVRNVDVICSITMKLLGLPVEKAKVVAHIVGSQLGEDVFCLHHWLAVRILSTFFNKKRSILAKRREMISYFPIVEFAGTESCLTVPAPILELSMPNMMGRGGVLSEDDLEELTRSYFISDELCDT